MLSKSKGNSLSWNQTQVNRLIQFGITCFEEWNDLCKFSLHKKLQAYYSVIRHLFLKKHTKNCNVQFKNKIVWDPLRWDRLKNLQMQISSCELLSKKSQFRGQL